MEANTWFLLYETCEVSTVLDTMARAWGLLEYGVDLNQSWGSFDCPTDDHGQGGGDCLVVGML